MTAKPLVPTKNQRIFCYLWHVLTLIPQALAKKATKLSKTNATIFILSSCFVSRRYRDPCSLSLNEDDNHTITLVGNANKKAVTLAKTCEQVNELRDCRAPRDWSILALQNTRTGKSHYLVICKCPNNFRLGELCKEKMFLGQVLIEICLFRGSIATWSTDLCWIARHQCLWNAVRSTNNFSKLVQSMEDQPKACNLHIVSNEKHHNRSIVGLASDEQRKLSLHF